MNTLELHKYTPAQALMLLRPLRATNEALLRYGFLDLVYRHVLKIYQEWRQPHPTSPVKQLYTYVCRGECFHAFQPAFCQEPFVAPFAAEDHTYLLRTLVSDVGRQHRRSGFRLKRVYRQLREEGYLYPSGGLARVNIYVPTQKGSALRKAFRQALKATDQTLPRYLQTDETKAREMMAALGSNVMLLECFDDERLRLINDLLQAYLLEYVLGISSLPSTNEPNLTNVRVGRAGSWGGF